MKAQHIQEMLKALKPVLKNRKKAEHLLNRYWSKRIALVWTVNDIHQAANERAIALTHREASKVLQELQDHYNPQYGIKWVDLWDLINDSGLGRRMTQAGIKTFVNKNQICIARTKK